MFFFKDTATTEIYPLSLHDALPILLICHRALDLPRGGLGRERRRRYEQRQRGGETRPEATTEGRSEEHTSELQSQSNFVSRLLFGKQFNWRRMHRCRQDCCATQPVV